MRFALRDPRWQSVLLAIACAAVIAIGQTPPVTPGEPTCKSVPNSNGGGGNWQACYTPSADGTTYDLSMEADTTGAGGWIGVGLNTGQSMGGSSVVIGYVDGSVSDVKPFNLISFDTTAPSAALGATNLKVETTTSANRIKVSYTIPAKNSYISASGDTFLMFARGPKPSSLTAGSVPIHQDGASGRGNYASFNFVTGTVVAGTEDENIPKLRKAHGIMMCFAWGLFMPLGIIAARHFRPYYTPRWFHAHRILMVIGLVLALAAWIIALDKLSFGRKADHRKIGFAVMIMSLAQPFIAAVRPHPPAQGEKPTMLRRVWAM